MRLSLPLVALMSCAIGVSQDARSLTLDQREEFLAKAKVIKTTMSSKGITGTIRATLSDGSLTHDASIQTIDDYKQQFQGASGGVEINFRDTFRYNLAAYRLDKLLGTHMVPATIERKHGGRTGSFTWWVDDVLMDEAARHAKKLVSPEPSRWNEQMYIVRVFDQLIANTDRNLGNLLIDKGWNLWMIDHSRAFRLHTSVLAPKNLTKCEEGFLDRLRKLESGEVTRAMQGALSDMEIRSMLKRRDMIVSHFDRAGAQSLYVMPMRQ